MSFIFPNPCDWFCYVPSKVIVFAKMVDFSVIHALCAGTDIFAILIVYNLCEI